MHLSEPTVLPETSRVISAKICKEYAGDELRPVFYRLYTEALTLAQPLTYRDCTNTEIIEILDSIIAIINNQPDISPYFEVQTRAETRQYLDFGFKKIKKLDLYKSGTPEFSASDMVTFTRDNAHGHAYEQMVFGLVFVLYCLAQPRPKSLNAARFRNWRQILAESEVPFHPRNVPAQGLVKWLRFRMNVLDLTVRLREQWMAGQAWLRLTPIEARMIALFSDQNEVSTEAINSAICSSPCISRDPYFGYHVDLKSRAGITGKIHINQGNGRVGLTGEAFRLDFKHLEYFGDLPAVAKVSLPKTQFEKICAIGVFEGQNMKVQNVNRLGDNLLLSLPKADVFHEYLLSPEAVERLTEPQLH